MKYSVIVYALLLATGFAQNMPVASQETSNPVVGMWQTDIPNEGGPPLVGVVVFSPDGSYREELMIQGELGGFWEGRYTLAPDGTLTQSEVNKSPQLCFQGECQPNDGPPVTVSKLGAVSPNSFTLTYSDGPQGYAATFQRVPQSASAAPTLQDQPLQPIASNVPASNVPASNVPASNVPASNVPVPNVAANPWAGVYSDGTITLNLRGPGEDYFERQGKQYPLQLRGSAERLEGTFSSDGNTFPVVLERRDGSVILTSGELSFTLIPLALANPLGPTPSAPPVNPLGDE
jgi:hypothetical protein